MKFYILFLIAIASFFSVAQRQAVLKLKSGTYSVEENIEQPPQVTQEETHQGRYYRIITFASIPKTKQKEELKKLGVELLSYLPEKSFYASLNKEVNVQQLQRFSVKSILEIKPHYKLSTALYEEKYGAWAILDNGRISLQANYFSNLEASYVIRELEQLGAEVQKKDTIIQLIAFDLPIEQLERVYKCPLFYYFEQKNPPPTPEGLRDVANHRSNYINTQYDGGLKYDGSGVNIMMQDDGPIGPHIDFQGRLDQRTNNDNGTHGDHCAGIIMGAGNKDPRGVGNAPGAFLYVYSSDNSNYSYVPTLYFDEGLVITSKSYGDGQNAGYTNLTRSLDFQSRYLESLIHVFSAGNSGGSDFGYGAGPGWGNITGGHKQGKNVIAVGNLTYLDELSGSSSKGPAADGRIKPDICAVGTDVYSTIDDQNYDSYTGTSMACPAVAGNLAQLYQAYREMNGGADPKNALMKGLILNTAEDLGNPGPDYKFGWGRINSRRAFDVLQAGNYQSDQIETGESNLHTIEVPNNTAQLRVMVYWTDYEGTVSSSKALVNDLDIELSDPNGTSYQPWVLYSTPNAGFLNQPAFRGTDDLNNVEQVTLNAPAGGSYTLTVNGTLVPEGPQEYFVIYEFVEDDITLTHPIGGESFAPGIPVNLRWDAFSTDASFEVTYSLDNGQTWNVINDNVPGEDRYLVWFPPNEITGKAKIKVRRNSVESQSPATFSILRSPSVINVEWACPNSFNISWNNVNGATGYVAYLLGDKYMDSVGTTTTNNITIYANSNETQWVSVKSLGPNGAESQRAIAIEKPPGTFNCTLNPPVADFAAACSTTGVGQCIRFEDFSTNAGQGAAWEWSFPGGSPSSSDLENPVVCYSTAGIYTASLVVKNGVGEDSLTLEEVIEVKEGQNLPYTEGFEEGIPTDWQMMSNTTAITHFTQAGSFTSSGSSMHFNSGSISPGEKASILTNGVNLSGTTAYQLSFDVAYGTGFDTLIVYSTDNCGVQLEELFRAGGTDLSTSTSTASPFIPNEDEWRRVFTPIIKTDSSNALKFQFEVLSSGGSNILVDNINIPQTQENFEEGATVFYPNPFDNVIHIAGIEYQEEVIISMYSYSGQKVYDYTFESPGGILSLQLDDLPQGPYYIHLVSENHNKVRKLIKVSGE